VIGPRWIIGSMPMVITAGACTLMY
jgi:hypothetical protein